jgi:zinc transport system permease protein
MIEAFQFEFMRNALWAGLLVSLVCGVIGTLVVVNRIVFISGGIAHASYGGIGIAFFFGLPYLPVTLGFAVLSAMIMAGITLKSRDRADTIIGVIWAAGMALGVILLDLTPGYNVDLMSYLFGSILTVPASDLKAMAVMAAVILGLIGYFYNEFLAISFDAEFARLRGAPVAFLHFLLLCMIAVSVVMIIRVVGLILVIALLTIPPYIAEQYADSLLKMMAASTVLSVLFTVSGLWISYAYNLTSGAAIIMTGGVAFFASIVIEKLRSNRRAG